MYFIIQNIYSPPSTTGEKPDIMGSNYEEVPMENLTSETAGRPPLYVVRNPGTSGAATGRAEVLCEKDRELMQEFSRLCNKRLDHYLPLKVFLSLFQHFMDANVQKELEKNRLVISHAAAAFAVGQDREKIDVDELFGMTKDVDHRFVKKIRTPFLSVRIRHDDFADIRKERIRSCAAMVFDLLANWQEVRPFTETVRTTYDEATYREIIGGMLHLYSVETRMIGNSITLHGPASRARDLFADKLFATMDKTAGELAEIHARRIYADCPVPPGSPS